VSEAIITKYRPYKFEDVIGQPHISSIQKKCALKKIPNAFLFSGVRGTGKTTTARIVAMSLNCANPSNGNPCLECDSCKSALRGLNPNIKEMDMATHRGIDQIRELQRDLQYAPVNDGYRVIILDEAHQITPQGASALLKPLEEPPANTLFILATTDPQKLLDTIKSRCEKYDFRRVEEDNIVERLIFICEQEEKQFDEEALRIVAKSCGGSVRDAETLLASYFSSDYISVQVVQELLTIESDFDKLLEYIQKNDKVGLLRYFKDNSNKISDESWLTLFTEFLISRAIKENSLSWSKTLSQLVEYMRWFNSNLPPTYIQLVFLKLADNFEYVEDKGIEISLIYRLANWFNAHYFEITEDLNGTLYGVDGLNIAYLDDNGAIDHLVEKYAIVAWFGDEQAKEILKLDSSIDKNELIELGLLNLIEEEE